MTHIISLLEWLHSWPMGTAPAAAIALFIVATLISAVIGKDRHGSQRN